MWHCFAEEFLLSGEPCVSGPLVFECDDTILLLVSTCTRLYLYPAASLLPHVAEFFFKLSKWHFVIRCALCFLAHCSRPNVADRLVVFSAAKSRVHRSLFTQQPSTSCSPGGADTTHSLLKCHSLRGAQTHCVTGQDVHLQERGKMEGRRKKSRAKKKDRHKRDNTLCQLLKCCGVWRAQKHCVTGQDVHFRDN